MRTNYVCYAADHSLYFNGIKGHLIILFCEIRQELLMFTGNIVSQICACCNKCHLDCVLQVAKCVLFTTCAHRCNVFHIRPQCNAALERYFYTYDYLHLYYNHVPHFYFSFQLRFFAAKGCASCDFISVLPFKALGEIIPTQHIQKEQ